LFWVLSRAVSAPLVFVIVNLTLSHQVEINQAFSLKKLQDPEGLTQVMFHAAAFVHTSIVRLFKCDAVSV
jgi:hypothetical protein